MRLGRAGSGWVLGAGLATPAPAASPPSRECRSLIETEKADFLALASCVLKLLKFKLNLH